MNVVVNGRRCDVRVGSTVSELVELLGFGARQVVVERNGEPVERQLFAEIVLGPDDVVEVVRAVAGG